MPKKTKAKAKTPKKAATAETRQPTLFDLGKAIPAEPAVKRLRHPVWTENKAKLIERYLKLFVMITKHGAYIDAFAGPQEADKPETWAAKLVLESVPRWFRNFLLFEEKPSSVTKLRELIDVQPPRTSKEPKRIVRVFAGDVNVELCKELDKEPIGQKEATFCLLDQRTFECHWRTVERVARYKQAPEHKIELFYFMPVAWIDRAISGVKHEEILRRWWGRDDWEQVRKARGLPRAQLFVERFKNELGYASVKPWPIYERASGGKIMYYMIHATDHPDAPLLMSRASGSSPEQAKRRLGARMRLATPPSEPIPVGLPLPNRLRDRMRVLQWTARCARYEQLIAALRKAGAPESTFESRSRRLDVPFDPDRYTRSKAP